MSSCALTQVTTHCDRNCKCSLSVGRARLSSLSGPLYSAALRRVSDTDNLRHRKLFRRAALPSGPGTRPATAECGVWLG